MTLGNIFEEAAKRDISAREKKGLEYAENIEDGVFKIKLSCEAFKEAWIECSVPNGYSEEARNYCYLSFLSMLYNAAIFGMKRIKEVKRKDIPLPLRKVENYCEKNGITPEALIDYYESNRYRNGGNLLNNL